MMNDNENCLVIKIVKPIPPGEKYDINKLRDGEEFIIIKIGIHWRIIHNNILLDILFPSKEVAKRFIDDKMDFRK